MTTRRALLLGCPDPGLAGVTADLAVMDALLRRHGFTDVVTLLRGDRAAILAALDDLVARTAPDDAVVLYYSGHGWRVTLPSARSGPRSFQGIAPADLHATTLADFRGVLADELSARIDNLTLKTANVTTIFDCCHATDITRIDQVAAAPPGLRVLPVPWRIEPAELFARLRELGLARPRLDPESNPVAVQLLACRPNEEAGEDPDAPGGLLTRALDCVLAGPGGDELIWEDVVRRIGARVRAVRLDQHPVVVGPASRRVFSLETRARDATAACFARSDALWISGGALTDIRVGDRFAAEPPERANLKVIAVHHQLAMATADRLLPDGASVRPVAWACPRAAVEVPAHLPRRAAIVAALTASGRLACAPAPDLPTIAALYVAEDRLAIRDPAGAVVRTGLGLDQVCTRLSHMARVETLRRLVSVAPLKPETHAFDLEWACAHPRRPLIAGASMPADAPVTACIRNLGRCTLFVSLFAAESGGRVVLLTRSQPNGVELLRAGTYNLGEDRYHGVGGVLLPGAPRPRRITLVAFVLSAGVPLGAWEAAPDDETGTAARAAEAVPGFPDHPATYSVASLDLFLT